MRTHALAGSLAFHAGVLLLLLLLVAVIRQSPRHPPAVLQFEPPIEAPRLPAVEHPRLVEDTPALIEVGFHLL